MTAPLPKRFPPISTGRREALAAAAESPYFMISNSG
jgi:hypothetical protein